MTMKTTPLAWPATGQEELVLTLQDSSQCIVQWAYCTGKKLSGNS